MKNNCQTNIVTDTLATTIPKNWKLFITNINEASLCFRSFPGRCFGRSNIPLLYSVNVATSVHEMGWNVSVFDTT